MSLCITILKWLQNLARNKLNSKPIPPKKYCAAGGHPLGCSPGSLIGSNCEYETVECAGSCLLEWKEFGNGKKHSAIRFVNPIGPK